MASAFRDWLRTEGRGIAAIASCVPDAASRDEMSLDVEGLQERCLRDAGKLAAPSDEVRVASRLR